MSIFAKILLATDGSEEAGRAARTAAALAGKTGSELHVVHVFGIVPWYPAYPGATDLEGAELEDTVLEQDLRRISERRARELLDAEVEKIRAVGGAPAQAYLREGGAPQEIVGLAEEIGAGLVVVGSRGRGRVRRALMGSVSDSVVRHAHCPVMVVRDDGHEPGYLPGRILLAIDGSEEAELAARVAAGVSSDAGSDLHLVHVAPLVPMFLASTEEEPARLAREGRNTLDEQASRIEAEGGKVAQTHLKAGAAAAEIVALAEDLGAGLIAMGSRGRGGMRRALTGSVSDSVVHHAHCTVLLVREGPWLEA